MLQNIRSKFFLEYIFNFIDEKRKLSIIIYNKELQSKLNRNINYYKGVSYGILKIDKNGIGKIYNIDGDLIFEGEYSNKKKNGKGKIYVLGKLIFDGEFKDGERNGIGKEFNLFGKTFEYEGEFKNGERNGKGKEYDVFSNIIFEGDYLDGKRWNGLSYFKYKGEKLLFEGEYKNGKIWSGKFYKTNNNEIESEIINGEGKYKKYDKFFGYLYFEGYLKNGEINGQGKEYKHDGKISFEGEYLNGKKNGLGKKYYSNGNLKFEGLYKEDMEWEGKRFNINGEKLYEIKDGNGQVKQYTFEGELIN